MEVECGAQTGSFPKHFGDWLRFVEAWGVVKKPKLVRKLECVFRTPALREQFKCRRRGG